MKTSLIYFLSQLFKLLSQLTTLTYLGNFVDDLGALNGLCLVGAPSDLLLQLILMLLQLCLLLIELLLQLSLGFLQLVNILVSCSTGVDQVIQLNLELCADPLDVELFNIYL